MLKGLLLLEYAIQVLIIGGLSTLFFDFIHVVFHLCLKSPNSVLRRIGRWHLVHHQFLNSRLEINANLWPDNLIYHAIPEFLIQIIACLFCLFFFSASAVFSTIVIEAWFFLLSVYRRGVDRNHSPVKRLPACSNGLLVTPEYHALHHVFPEKYFGSVIRLIDNFLGSGCQIARKKIMLTGASGALGSALKQQLEKAGALVTTPRFGVDYHYEDYDKIVPLLKTADILVLCHGSKYQFAQQANCDSFIAIIELYKQVKVPALYPAEVWAVGSEIEIQPCFGRKKIKDYASSKRNFARAARVYFHEQDILYRHMIYSRFTSSMGRGFMSADFAARVTLFLIKRGFKYIPVTYTGLAFLNYFRYLFKTSHSILNIKQN
ncbi:hypothetical protein [Legionella sp. 16cNR16C]|uniref:hypothetical protein n=1 Tax=Legionella sp. 16cNR16C TaxID=2905656 RepID=UPI001E5B6A85|nr:hypothetical protein [Legionella sp. 16cNR16C]MCE3045133.1 hypothetical protein [Legionella sp. 16cNR16C]